MQNLRKLHEKEVQNVIREAAAYQKAAQGNSFVFFWILTNFLAYQQQGARLAIELGKLGKLGEKEKWGKFAD